MAWVVLTICDKIIKCPKLCNCSHYRDKLQINYQLHTLFASQFTLADKISLPNSSIQYEKAQWIPVHR